MKYEVLRNFVKRDGRSFSKGQVVEESQLGEVGDLVSAKFLKPTEIRTATIKPETEVKETAKETKKKKKG